MGEEWLHGSLLITVVEAVNVPHVRPIAAPEVGPFTRFLGNLQRGMRLERLSDSYVTVDLGVSRLARTHVVKASENARFDEAFDVLVANCAGTLVFKLKDIGSVGTELLGQVVIDVGRLSRGQVVEERFRCTLADGTLVPEATTLHLRVQYRPCLTPCGIAGELAAAPARAAVPATYFPMRDGCQLTLYQDAHQVPGTCAPIGPLAYGETYTARSCWDDLYSAICAARHFIYVLGWDVDAATVLCRAQGQVNGTGTCPTIGELLKSKARDGVQVLLLVWEDRTSLHNLVVQTNGVTNTHAQETKAFFRGTGVQFKSRPRVSSTQESSTLLNVKTDWWFSHHEKCWVMDSPTRPPDERQVLAFMGGLDVTAGRYDTQQHSLFRTLTTVHVGDYYQSCIPGASMDHGGGPRLPWHDIHCCVAGPVALDVMRHFEQRWGALSGGKHNAMLFPLAQIRGACMWQHGLSQDGTQHIDPVGTPALNPANPSAWCAQLFRTVDSDSVVFSTDNAQASMQGLATGKGKAVDTSCHKAYVHAIRRAQHFIYIENQYFVGSSHLWHKNRDAGATHLIPAELALKIVSKIQAGQRFMVYIVLPMFPEGDPGSDAIQEILCFQAATMRFMYGMIGGALAAKGPAAAATGLHPRDYLAFFCLGNRELYNATCESPVPAPLPVINQHHALAQASRRFQIYVHSKVMIVDDEFLIMGSANLNQRSLDGSRDTELALGGYQAAHLAGQHPAQLPRGQVAALRLSLWQEHTNRLLPSYFEPASLQCCHELAALGRDNWDAWAGPTQCDLSHHLLNYPVHISESGSLGPLAGFECFPDTEAAVLGKAGLLMPDQLTT